MNIEIFVFHLSNTKTKFTAHGGFSVFAGVGERTREVKDQFSYLSLFKK
jgi:F0F1-type ATP synthase beta subunit